MRFGLIGIRKLKIFKLEISSSKFNIEKRKLLHKLVVSFLPISFTLNHKASDSNQLKTNELSAINI